MNPLSQHSMEWSPEETRQWEAGLPVKTYRQGGRCLVHHRWSGAERSTALIDALGRTACERPIYRVRAMHAQAQASWLAKRASLAAGPEPRLPPWTHGLTIVARQQDTADASAAGSLS